MITVFADKYLYKIADFLPGEVDLHLYDPELGLPADSSMDALLIRTVTKINSDTWQEIPGDLQFVGTGSSGTDHVEIPFLQSNDISFADAGGCNARSVAEYMAVCLLLWADNFGINLREISAGIVGVGHVGSQVNRILQDLEVETILHDPPRANSDPNFQSAELSEVLRAEVLTIHTPLSHHGDHPTYHWLDSGKLASADCDLVINSARGGVVDEHALREAFETGTLQNFILDVWEEEPIFDDSMARKTWIKTPHIAGYSIQAKMRASKLVASALCRHFSLTMPETTNTKPGGIRNEVNFDQSQQTELSEIISRLHPLRSYEKELEKLIGMPQKEKGFRFNKLRAEFPLRDEFSYISVPEDMLDRYPVLEKLGFNAF